MDEDMDVLIVEKEPEVEQPPPTIPPETIEKLGAFNETLTELEDALKSHFEIGFDEHKERSALEMARTDLMSMFTLNVVGWTLCSLNGQDPKENLKLAQDLKRTKDYIKRFKSIEERKTAPRVNPVAAKNFVRNALFEIPPPKEKD